MKNITSKLKQNIIDSIILFPFFWAFTGNFAYNDGQKQMPILIFIATVTSLYFYGTKNVIKNLKETKLLWILAASVIFAIFAYQYYDYGSKRLRAFISLFIYFSIFPQILISKINLKHLTILGVITASTYVFTQEYIFELNRNWHRNPLPYATFIASMAILSLYFLLQSKSPKSTTLWLLNLLFSVGCLFYSQSRGPILALIVVATILIISTLRINRKNTIIIISTTIVILVSAYFSSDKLNQNINRTYSEIQKMKDGNFDTSFGVRLQMWQIAPIMIKESPILGIGEEHLKIKQNLASKGLISPNIVKYKNYHNQYIDDIVKYGIVGLSLLLILILFPIYCFFKNDHPQKWPGFLVVLTFSIVALTYVPFRGGDTLTLYLIVIYITLCAPSFNSKHS